MIDSKIHAFSSTVTVGIMFVSIMFLQPAVSLLGLPEKLVAAAAAVVGSFGIYRLIASVLNSAYEKFLWVRKTLLGKEFLEGTWVGYYENDGYHNFTIEHFDQSKKLTTIHGREFDAEYKPRASWESDSVTIDLNKKRLVYAYSCNVLHKKEVHEGLGSFAIIAEHPSKYPTKLSGYSTDLIDGDRDPNEEVKIADFVTGDIEALEKARKIFGIKK